MALAAMFAAQPSNPRLQSTEVQTYVAAANAVARATSSDSEAYGARSHVDSPGFTKSGVRQSPLRRDGVGYADIDAADVADSVAHLHSASVQANVSEQSPLLAVLRSLTDRCITSWRLQCAAEQVGRVCFVCFLLSAVFLRSVVCCLLFVVCCRYLDPCYRYCCQVVYMLGFVSDLVDFRTWFGLRCCMSSCCVRVPQDGAVTLLSNLLRRSADLPTVLHAAVYAVEALSCANAVVAARFFDSGVAGMMRMQLISNRSARCHGTQQRRVPCCHARLCRFPGVAGCQVVH
jgi:hypothetical protein